jgi:uncharacterized membrane protein
MLMAAVGWDAISAIAAVTAIGVTIWAGLATRGKSRISVTAYVDETWHMEVVVSNEKGTNPITVTSIAPKVYGKVVRTQAEVTSRDVDAGKTETWSFDILPPADAMPDTSQVMVRVDSGKRHWIAKAEYGPVLTDP